MSDAETILFLMSAGILLIVVNFAFNVVWSNRDSKTLEEKLADALADLDRREAAFLEMVDREIERVREVKDDAGEV